MAQVYLQDRKNKRFPWKARAKRPDKVIPRYPIDIAPSGTGIDKLMINVLLGCYSTVHIMDRPTDRIIRILYYPGTDMLSLTIQVCKEITVESTETIWREGQKAHGIYTKKVTCQQFEYAVRDGMKHFIETIEGTYAYWPWNKSKAKPVVDGVRGEEVVDEVAFVEGKIKEYPEE